MELSNIGVALALALFGAMLFAWLKPFFASVPGVDPLHDLYGSAHIFDAGRHRIAGIETARHGVDAIIMGVNALGAPEGCFWRPAVDQGHAFAFGATRNGKFTALLVLALMSWAGGVLVIDPKAESAWATAERRRQMGQKVVILDPWGEVNRRYGDPMGVSETISRFNPLAHLDPTAKDFGDDVAMLADALIVTHGTETQPHWPDAARDLVAGLIAAVVEWKPGRGTLADVRRLLTATNEELSEHVLLIASARPDSLAAAKLRRFVTVTTLPDGSKIIGKESNEIASIRSTGATQTAILDTVRLMESMESAPDAFDMAELPSGRVSLYVVLPLEKLETHGRWLRLVVTLAIRAMSKAARPPELPVLFMLDEMGTIGKLAAVETAVGLLAGMGVRIWGFLQDITQLQGDYPTKWQTFLANASVIQVLKCTESTTTRYFSEFLGTKTIIHDSVSHSVSRSAQGGSSSESTNRVYYSRPVRLPAEIENMPDDELLVLYTGGQKFQLRKATYFKGAEGDRWQGLYRPNPLYPLPDWWKNRQRKPVPEPVETPPQETAEAVRVVPGLRAASIVRNCPQSSCGRLMRVPANRGAGWVTCPACRFRWKLEVRPAAKPMEGVP